MDELIDRKYVLNDYVTNSVILSLVVKIIVHVLIRAENDVDFALFD